MMADIYSQAQEVVVWIPVAQEDQAAVSKFASYVEGWMNKRSMQSSLPDGAIIPDWWVDHEMIEHDQALQVILRSSFWERLWIIQELGLARRKTIQFGASCCSGKPLQRWLKLTKDYSTPGLHGLPGPRKNL